MLPVALAPEPEICVTPDLPLPELLARLLDAPGRVVGVSDGDCLEGVVTESSLLEGLGRLIPPRFDSSVLTLRCTPAEFSASRIAHAVEDAGANILDFFSTPAPDGMLEITLRVHSADPSSAIHHLERYGFEVADAAGSRFVDAETAADRLHQLQVLINV